MIHCRIHSKDNEDFMKIRAHLLVQSLRVLTIILLGSLGLSTARDVEIKGQNIFLAERKYTGMGRGRFNRD